MTRRRRPPSLFARALAILLMIPGLLQVPLPQVDFHVIRHRHGSGEVCPKHDHLLRWHPQAGEGDDVAVLHWHWLLPRASESADSDRSIPALHAHDGDADRPEPSSSPIVVREASGAESRNLFGSSPDPAQPHAGWAAPLPFPRPAFDRPYRGISDGAPSGDVLSRLVRWKC